MIATDSPRSNSIFHIHLFILFLTDCLFVCIFTSLFFTKIQIDHISPIFRFIIQFSPQ